MELIEVMKIACQLNCELYKAGCLRAGGYKKKIQLDEETFRELFSAWEIGENYGDGYIEIFANDGEYKFFTLCGDGDLTDDDENADI